MFVWMSVERHNNNNRGVSLDVVWKHGDAQISNCISEDKKQQQQQQET